MGGFQRVASELRWGEGGVTREGHWRVMDPGHALVLNPSGDHISAGIMH